MKLPRIPISQESSVFLNIIRLVACEMVVIGHFLTKYQPALNTASFTIGSVLGGVAVLLFFALSGLLICHSLLNKIGNNDYRFRNYFVDRFSRIYSGLVPALILAGVFALLIYVTNQTYFTSLCAMQNTPSLLNFGMTLGMLERFPASLFGLPLPFPAVTPFGFNGILWTLVVEWWIYMFFGWLVIGSLRVMEKRKSYKPYWVLFFAVAALLSLVLLTLFQEYSSFIIVWFAGALMMLAISSSRLNSILSSSVARNVLEGLFQIFLAITIFDIYVIFAWTRQYYDVLLGLLLSICVFLGVLLLNGRARDRGPKLIFNKKFVSIVNSGAGFSFTLFLTHYPILIFLNGLNLSVDRFYMIIPILLITNVTAFIIAYFTEKKHKQIAYEIKKLLCIPQC